MAVVGHRLRSLPTNLSVPTTMKPTNDTAITATMTGSGVSSGASTSGCSP